MPDKIVKMKKESRLVARPRSVLPGPVIETDHKLQIKAKLEYIHAWDQVGSAISWIVSATSRIIGKLYEVPAWKYFSNYAQAVHYLISFSGSIYKVFQDITLELNQCTSGIFSSIHQAPFIHAWQHPKSPSCNIAASTYMIRFFKEQQTSIHVKKTCGHKKK